MRPENLGFHGDNSRRASEAILWIIAFDAFDYGDPAPLDEILRGAEPVPPELRPIIADIVSGRRKPNLRAAAKLKIPAAERMKIAAYASVVLGLADMLQFDPKIDLRAGDITTAPSVKPLDLYSDLAGVEPIDIARDLNAAKAEVMAAIMEEYGVSLETAENLLRTLRKKIREYPDI